MNALYVYVPRETYRRAKSGEQAARDEMKRKLHGVVIYDHVFSAEPDDIAVQLDDLINMDVIEAVTLDCAFYCDTKDRLGIGATGA
jgi:hypothetical protein